MIRYNFKKGLTIQIKTFDKSYNLLYNHIVIEKERDLYPPEYK